MKNMLYTVLAWSLAPLLSAVLWPGVTFAKFLCARLPPVRWTLFLAEKCLQVVACVQVSFVLLTAAKMAWSIGCVALCWVSDFVERNHETANLQAFAQRYYWPPDTAR